MEKPVIARVKRRTSQSSFAALWLNINGTASALPLTDSENSTFSGRKEEKEIEMIPVLHMETVRSSEATVETVQSLLDALSFVAVVDCNLLKVVDDKKSEEGGNIGEKFLVCSAQFKQTWSNAEGNGGMYSGFQEVSRFFDLIRVDSEETVNQEEQSGKYAAGAAAENELDDYAYDFYVETVAVDITDAESMHTFPLVVVSDENHNDCPEQQDHEVKNSRAGDNLPATERVKDQSPEVEKEKDCETDQPPEIKEEKYIETDQLPELEEDKGCENDQPPELEENKDRETDQTPEPEEEKDSETDQPPELEEETDHQPPELENEEQGFETAKLQEEEEQHLQREGNSYSELQGAVQIRKELQSIIPSLEFKRGHRTRRSVHRRSSRRRPRSPHPADILHGGREPPINCLMFFCLTALLLLVHFQPSRIMTATWCMIFGTILRNSILYDFYVEYVILDSANRLFFGSRSRWPHPADILHWGKDPVIDKMMFFHLMAVLLVVLFGPSWMALATLCLISGTLFLIFLEAQVIVDFFVWYFMHGSANHRSSRSRPKRSDPPYILCGGRDPASDNVMFFCPIAVLLVAHFELSPMSTATWFFFFVTSFLVFLEARILVDFCVEYFMADSANRRHSGRRPRRPQPAYILHGEIDPMSEYLLFISAMAVPLVAYFRPSVIGMCMSTATSGLNFWATSFLIFLGALMLFDFGAKCYMLDSANRDD